MNILILSCNTGEGHNAAARAIREHAERSGNRAEIVDYLNFFNEKVNRLTCETYTGVVRHVPAAFGAFYHFGMMVSRMMPGETRSILYHGSRIAARKLWAYLQEHPADAVICTHMLAAEAVAWLRNHGYAVPFSVVVATDYTCYPFLREAALDYYIVPHPDVARKCMERGIPREKLLALGIPVSGRFSALPDQTTAKRMLGLPDVPLYLVMGGSMGAGRLRTFTRRLLPRIGDGLMVVVCGRNDALRESLERQFAGRENVRILGFTENVPVFMAACDCLYTKPGGLTSTETLVSGAPVVHTKPIPGCESDNFRFFAENGLSVPAKRIRRQIALGIELAQNPEKRRRMRVNQSACARPQAASSILELVGQNVGRGAC